MVVRDALAGRDLLVQSPTGSGKTLAFGAPLVDLIQSEDNGRITASLGLDADFGSPERPAAAPRRRRNRRRRSKAAA